MKRYLLGGLAAMALISRGLTAERLPAEPGAEPTDYFEHNHEPVLVEWQHPDYPAEPKAGWAEEQVRVSYLIDPAGRAVDARVTAGPQRFHAVALAALAKWKFKPAVQNDQPVTVNRETVFVFTPAGPPKRTSRDDFMPPYELITPPNEPPGDPYNPDPPYPAILAARRLSGEVELELGISAAGRVDGVQIVRATHPDFLSAALETVAAWECSPARQGRVPIAGRKLAVLQFFPVDEGGQDVRRDWLEHAGIFLRDGPNVKSADYFDEPVVAARMVDPVYPYALALAGTRGAARVNFSVNLRGRVQDVSVAEATEPEFGEALAAAIAAWLFVPLHRGGEECGADFSITWRFTEPRVGSPEQRLLARVAAGEPVVGARQLDRPPFPLFRVPAVFPAGRLDAGEAGRAEIEAIVDRDGRVRLARVRGASGPEFGWAAATALSQWVFETPRKDGQPVDVRIVLPVDFKAPPPPPAPGEVPKPAELQ